MFALTDQERRVIVFLLSLACAGLGVQLIARCCYPGRAIARVNRTIGKIDLNTADAKTLMTVRGIGPVLAARIVEYRALHGRISDTRCLLCIKGFSRSRYERIRDLVYALPLKP